MVFFCEFKIYGYNSIGYLPIFICCMKWIKKLIVYVFVFWFIVSNIFFGYTFADWNSWTNDCPTCRATPVWMQSYINFEVEVLGLLQWVSARVETLWKNTKSWLFAGWVLGISNTFVKWTVKKIQNDLDSELKAARALAISSVLLEKITLSNALWDGIGAISVLFKSEAFVRDYKILQELDMSINDVIWDMGVNGTRDDKISPAIQTNLSNLQRKYSKASGGSVPIFEKITISGNVKNKQLLTFLLRLNVLMKTMLYSVNDKTHINYNAANFEERYSKWNIVVQLNRDYINSIAVDYSCATMKICSAKLSESLKNFWNRYWFTNSFWQAMKTIKDANKNLKEAYQSTPPNFSDDSDKKWTWWLTDRQVQLLRTVYGIDAKDLTNTQIETLKHNRETIKEEMQPVSSVLTTLWNKTKSVFSKKKDKQEKMESRGDLQQTIYQNSLTAEQKQSLSEELFWQQLLPLAEKDQLLVDTMQDVANSILIEKSDDKQIVMIWTNADTHYFVEIGAYIHSIVDEEIWTKTTDWLIKKLWDTCVYQCNNKWNDKCFAD